MFGFWTKSQQQQQTSIPASTERRSTAPGASGAEGGAGSALTTSLAVAISADLAESRPPTSTGSALTGKANGQTDIAAPRPSTDPDIAEIQKVPRASLQVNAASSSNQNISESPRRTRRLSFQSFSFGQSKNKQPAEPISQTKQVKKEAAEEALKERKLPSTREARKIDKAAAALATIILGPVEMVAWRATSVTISSKTPIQPPKPKPAGPQTIQKVQGQLLTPKQANKVIAKLRTINPVEESPNTQPHEPAQHAHKPGERPIHAVCLDCTDEEADKYHFSQLAATPEVEMRNFRREPAPPRKPGETSFASADITTVVPLLRSMKLVTLVTAPDLGFGQPPDGPGLLAGSVPSSQALGEGLQEITGQLIALGFASSKVVFPSHTGVYPPIDRMSVLTCASTPSGLCFIVDTLVDWWGLEVCLPPPSMTYLAVSRFYLMASLPKLVMVIPAERQIDPELCAELPDRILSLQQWCEGDSPFRVS
jgi:hypothetical protein